MKTRSILICILIGASYPGCDRIFSSQIVQRTCSSDLSVCAQETPFSSGSIFGIWGSDMFGYWAIGAEGGVENHGVIVHWNGHKWASQMLPVTNRIFYGIWGMSDKDIWVVGQKSTILHWNGETWEISNFGEDNAKTLKSIFGMSQADVLAVGEQSLVLRWNGKMWAGVDGPVPVGQNWSGVWGLPNTAYWLVGDNGRIDILSTGITSALVNIPTTISDNLYGLYGLNQSSVLAVGANGAFVKISNQTIVLQDHLKDQSLGTASALQSIWIGQQGRVWAVGSDSKNCRAAYTIEVNSLKRHAGDFDQTGETVCGRNNPTYYSVRGSNDDDVWVGGTGGTIQRRRVVP